MIRKEARILADDTHNTSFCHRIDGFELPHPEQIGIGCHSFLCPHLSDISLSQIIWVYVVYRPIEETHNECIVSEYESKCEHACTFNVTNLYVSLVSPWYDGAPNPTVKWELWLSLAPHRPSFWSAAFLAILSSRFMKVPWKLSCDRGNRSIGVVEFAQE